MNTQSLKKYIDVLIIILYVLYLIWELTPYFTWITYKGGLLGYIFGIPLQYLFALGVIIIYFLGNPHIKTNNKEFKLIIGVFILGIIHTGICGLKFSNLLSSIWIRYIMIIMYILFPKKLKINIFNIYKMVFAMTLIPAILYSLLNLCGINIAHDYIEPIEQIKTNNYYSYAHYPFAVQLHNSVRVDLVSPYRICGIYNEAGLVGTVCSLFLTADKFQFKRKWDNVILLVGGFLSFSMAFYFMVIVYYALVNLGKHKLKNAIALSSIIILFFVFMNFEFSNPALSSLQARLQITQEGLVGDNRTNERFDAIYSSIYDDPTALFIGYGMGEIGAIQRNLLLDGSSYKCLIYDYGYIGFGLFIIWIFYAVNIFKGQKNNLNIFILLFMYIINIYQRPTMFYPAYLIILIGGCCKMSEKNPLIKIGANRLI